MRRVRGGELLLAGESPRVVAVKVGVSRQTVYAWKARLEEQGNDPSALLRLDRGGAPARLSAAQKLELASLVEGRAEYLVPPGGWTLKRVSQLIEQRFGESYSLTQVWRLLRGMDCATGDSPPAARIQRVKQSKRGYAATAEVASKAPRSADLRSSLGENDNETDSTNEWER